MKANTFGIIYSYNENWMGGTYYVQNLIRSFLTLPPEKQPHLVIFTKTAEEYEHISALGYERITRREIPEPEALSIPKRVFNKVLSKVAGREQFYPQIRLKSKEKLVVFPATLGIKSQNILPLYWIPDFQEEFLPHLFSNSEIKFRRIRNRSVASGHSHVVLSSEHARSNFLSLFPKSKAQLHVLRFAVTNNLPSTSESEETLLERYNVKKPYFFIPNQFWAHKNHLTVLRALANLRERGSSDVRVVFSGKEHDYRNPDYFNNLKKLVAETGIEDQVRFLGFIDRGDQLRLMNASHAVIQPSLFEGWSTVVEDAKSMQKVILVSNLPVHREQLGDRGVYFESEDADQLAGLMVNELENRSKPSSTNYATSITEFAETFLQIVDAVEAKN